MLAPEDIFMVMAFPGLPGPFTRKSFEEEARRIQAKQTREAERRITHEAKRARKAKEARDKVRKTLDRRNEKDRKRVVAEYDSS